MTRSDLTSATRAEPLVLTAAERARTVVAGASSLRVGVLDVAHDVQRHAVCPDGSLLFVAPGDSPARVLGYANLPSQRVTATAIDVAAVPMPDRVRGRLTLGGRLGSAPERLPAGVREHLVGPGERAEPAGPILHLVPTAVHLEWFCEPVTPRPEPTSVAIEDYRSASPDVLVAHEIEWLPHLFHDHADVLRPLARASDDDDVRPLAIDRHGLVLRSHRDEIQVDVRLPFPRPVRCACEVRAAFLQLLDQARHQG